MARAFWIAGIALFLVAIIFGLTGFFLCDGYIQGLLGNLATETFGLAIAVLLINTYLSASEKGAAAAPLVKLIAPAIQELNNDLHVEHLKNTFGIEKMRNILDVYKKNKGNPRAFSPEQCDELHAAIMAKTTELVRVYDLLIDQFRELSMITGWSFDPSVTAAALEARLNMVKFKSIQSATDQDSKYQIVEAYLDAKTAATAVFVKLVKRLGLPDEDWKEEV